MYYLTDIGLFIAICLVPGMLGFWRANPRWTMLENALVWFMGFEGLYSLLTWLGGLTIGLRFPVWPYFLLLLVGLAWPHPVPARDRLRQGWGMMRAFLRDVLRLPWFDKGLLLYLGTTFIVTFAATLAPPNGNDYDSLTYHLAAPRQYLRFHHIVPLPYDHHTFFPFGMEMLYLSGLWLRGPVLAKLFHWLMFRLTCLAILAMGQRHLSFRAGLLGAVLFAALPVVQAEATTAYIDLGLAAFSTLAFLCFLNWRRARERNWLVWSGVFCGCCLGLKYLGILTLGWLGLWAVGVMWRQRPPEDASEGGAAARWDVLGLAGFAAAALLVGGGWYARNWLWTGNPVFPFAYGLFGGRGWTAAMAAAYTQDLATFGFGRGAVNLIWLPWRLAMAPLNVIAVDPKYGPVLQAQPFWPWSNAVDPAVTGRFEVAGQVLQSFTGPLLLAFGLTAAAMRRKPPVVGFALWSFLGFFAVWAATSQQLRYLIAIFPLLSLACGWAAAACLRRGGLLKWSAAASVAAWLVFALWFNLKANHPLWPVVAGRQTPDDYLTHTFPGYAAMQWASTNTPANARFAVYGEPRCFYLDRDYFWADQQHNLLLDYDHLKTAPAFVAALRAQHATYVLWNFDASRDGGFGGPPPQIDAAIQQGLLRPRYEARGYRVYAIGGGGAP